MKRCLIGSLLILLLLITACGDATSTPEPVSPQPDQPAAPTATVPAEDATTPESEEYPAPETPAATPEAEGESYPAPTGESTPADADTRATGDYPAPSDCDTAVGEAFAGLLDSKPEVATTLGCPLAEASTTPAAWQVFENENQMVWLESEDAILAMYNGQWHGFEDTFEEGSDPEVPPEAPTPPADDRYQAVRGFGQVWVDRVDEIGFAVSREEAYEATVQQFQEGWLLTTPFGQVFVLENMNNAQTGTGPYQVWLDREGGWVSGAEAD